MNRVRILRVNITLMSVQPLCDTTESELKAKFQGELELENDSQIVIENNYAEIFLEKNMTKNYLGQYIINEMF